MKSTTLKLAASGLVLGLMTVGCQMNGAASRPVLASATPVRPATPSTASARSERGAERQAQRLHRAAQTQLAGGDLDGARATIEQAVALSPRDVGYRLMLADIYMRGGRFRSAETAYRDVLAIDPGQSRAGLTMALMMAANGRSQDALARLETLEGQPAAADLGLAFALAGAPQRGIAILEPAARGLGATARIRQNLALAYALAGDWGQARTIAAQDISPTELTERMTQWAALAQGGQPARQVAAMIGVEPVEDPGRPVRLGLNAPASDAAVAVDAPAHPVQLAMAEPPQSDPAQGEDALPPPVGSAGEEVMANIAPVAAPAPVVAPAASAAYAELEQPEWGVTSNGAIRLPETDPEAARLPALVRYAAATEALTRPSTPLNRTHRGPPMRQVPVARFVAPEPAGDATAPRISGSGRFVVQIGAFSSATNAERAWQQAETRFGLTARQPVTMTFDWNGRLLHRVAMSGFDSRADAARLCAAILGNGGDCFVRTNAGDAAIRWASRYIRRA